MKKRFVLFLLALSISALYATTAKAVFTLCNKTGDKVEFAMIYTNYYAFAKPPSFPAKGWFTLENGDCRDIFNGQGFAFFSIVIIRDGYTPFIMPTKIANFINNDLDNLPSNGHSGVVRIMCIPPGRINNYYKETLSDYKKCRKGEVKRLFNLFVQADGKRNYTLDLTQQF